MAFDLHKYIRVHFAYELEYLLVGATAWSARQGPPAPGQPDVATLAMEVAYVHVRNLNEFFQTRRPTAKQIQRVRLLASLKDQVPAVGAP